MTRPSRSEKSTVGTFAGNQLDRVAFPMGGMGAGMICLEGTGGFSAVSLRHNPEVFNVPWMLAAITVKGRKSNASLALEGPVPVGRIAEPEAAKGSGQRNFGFPRFKNARFSARFPFGTVELSDPTLPLKATIVGWSPFVPNDAESASLPIAGVEYTFRNTGAKPVEAVFSFHSWNIVRKGEGPHGVRSHDSGMLMWQSGTPEKPWHEGWCTISADAPDGVVDAQWFRGGWFDNRTMIWKNVASAALPDKPSIDEGAGREGASIYVPIRLKPGESRTVALRICWYVPRSDVRTGFGKAGDAITSEQPAYRPWYADRFSSVQELAVWWRARYQSLRNSTAVFTDTLFASTIQPEIVEAVAANLSILKSPSILRLTDGRLWIWEGCNDCSGCCHGSCTHVLNYAQALAHLFPALERTLRNAEYNENQNAAGHQNFRSRLPLVENDHGFHAAADGQLGGIMKVYRDWRISGDTAWLVDYWPKVTASLDYCIEIWDPRHHGVLEEPHHNTYDIEFWGPDGMCTTFYLGALRAAIAMAEALGEKVPLYRTLLAKGTKFLEIKLYNGEYFDQKVVWKNLHAPDPVTGSHTGLGLNYSSEAIDLLHKEGPKYQYGSGCLSDGVLGIWMAKMCGVPDIGVDPKKEASHIKAVFRHNFKTDLSYHVNPQRPSYALGAEAGLLLCTWPRGGKPSLPFVYSDEVWTGIEYQVAAHLILIGEVEKGLAVVKALRSRYDGRVRNPFDEFECGHWYTRALASYSLLQAISGLRYDAVDKTLFVAPKIKGDFSCFLSTETGFGLVSVTKGKVTVEVAQGAIDISRVMMHGKVQKSYERQAK